jgi:hypothetical protein
MTRDQLEHIVRAAGAITESDQILVIGSQSILGSFPDAPPPLNTSIEADVCPFDAPEKADLISGSIGEITLFQATFGYYAHGLPAEACALPADWRTRLVSFCNANTRGCTALCLHPDDLACAKLAAGRPKDKEFVAAMLAYGMTHAPRLTELIPTLEKQENRESAERNLVICRNRATALTRE